MKRLILLLTIASFSSFCLFGQMYEESCTEEAAEMESLSDPLVKDFNYCLDKMLNAYKLEIVIQQSNMFSELQQIEMQLAGTSSTNETVDLAKKLVDDLQKMYDQLSDIMKTLNDYMRSILNNIR
ncbi:MAG: hypothetical protein KFF49_02500 [Bacteroidales bacterium]|nr:hypothetical protein [Bacteroidales bacterium]